MRISAADIIHLITGGSIMTRRLKCIALLALAFGASWPLYSGPRRVGADARKPVDSGNVRDFLAANCFGCHDGATRKGNLDLTSLKPDWDDAKTFAAWVRVHDRVRDGEMPPKGMPRPEEGARAGFLKALAAPMVAADEARARREGRAVWRRMNRYEYENTLRDLLGAPWLQIKELLPEDGEAYRYNKVGDALDVSHVHMNQYLSAAEYALREVLPKGTTKPVAETHRYYARDSRAIS